MDAWEYKQDISLEISVYTLRGGGALSSRKHCRTNQTIFLSLKPVYVCIIVFPFKGDKTLVKFSDTRTECTNARERNAPRDSTVTVKVTDL